MPTAPKKAQMAKIRIRVDMGSGAGHRPVRVTDCARGERASALITPQSPGPRPSGGGAIPTGAAIAPGEPPAEPSGRRRRAATARGVAEGRGAGPAAECNRGPEKDLRSVSEPRTTHMAMTGKERAALRA